VPGSPVLYIVGKKPMRKGILLLAVLLAASFATTADAAKKKAKAPAKPAPISSNEAAGKLLTGAVTNLTVVPAVAAQQKAAPAKPAAKPKKAKKKAMKKKAA
jgi:hypothetical protein